MQNKLYLSQKLMQKLSPQQIQLMKLLQVPTAMLDQRIQEELEINPALEETAAEEEAKETETAEEESYEEEDIAKTQEESVDEYLENYMNDDTALYRLQANNHSPDDKEKTIPIAVEYSFHDHLQSQLGLLTLNERQTKIARQIIGSIDEDGYLRRSPLSITDDLAFAQSLIVSEEEVHLVLKQIQRFEPAGIGARNLQECLLLQLQAKLKSADTHYSRNEIHHLRIARTIIGSCFEAFSKKHYKKLMFQLSLNRDELIGAKNEILKLNPKPGGGYAPSTKLAKQYIIPDFTIENKDGILELQVNGRNAPELRVNRHYREMLNTYSHNKKDEKQRKIATFVKQKIEAAKWFIDAIQQRQQTMKKIMYAILQYQYDFLLTGDERNLKPMILKDLSAVTGLDISTISRVVNHKYVQTEFGIKRLRYFFSEGLKTNSGESVSTVEVRKILAEIIKTEDKRKPFSDEKLKDLLRARGYNIARRTVAKYREKLNIPVSRLRKEI